MSWPRVPWAIVPEYQHGAWPVLCHVGETSMQCPTVVHHARASWYTSPHCLRAVGAATGRTVALFTCQCVRAQQQLCRADILVIVHERNHLTGARKVIIVGVGSGDCQSRVKGV